jgi:hypothetical protein
MAFNKEKKKDKNESVAVYKRKIVQQRRIPIDDDGNKKNKKKRNVTGDKKVIDSPTRNKRINDYLSNVSDDTVSKKNVDEPNDAFIDCCDEKTTNPNVQHVYHKNMDEHKEELIDCCDEQTSKLNEESKLEQVDETVITTAIVKPNYNIPRKIATQPATVINPYNNKGKNTVSSQNITKTNKQDDTVSMPSVPEVVNVTRNSNIVSPFSIYKQKSPAVQHDLGINIISYPTAASLGINLLPSNLSNYYGKPTARIRCAYVNGNGTQSVIFFFEEMTLNAYFAQTYFLTNLKENQSLQNLLPWEIPGANSEVIKLFINNKFVQGKEQGHGYTLFIYTHGAPFQNRELLRATAYKLCAIAQKIVKNKQNVIVDEETLFLHSSSCVWSSIINQVLCVSRLSTEANDILMNDPINVRNPRFWDRHKTIIRKYFNPNKLTVELAIKFNAPLDEIDPTIRLTAAFIEQVQQRRLLIDTWQDIVQDVLPSNIDPTSYVNYNISPNELNGDNDIPSHEDLSDFVENLGNFD